MTWSYLKQNPLQDQLSRRHPVLIYAPSTNRKHVRAFLGLLPRDLKAETLEVRARVPEHVQRVEEYWPRDAHGGRELDRALHLADRARDAAHEVRRDLLEACDHAVDVGVCGTSKWVRS